MKLFLLLMLAFSASAVDLTYVNWENHPVHALDISPDKTRMAIAHTADNRVQLFDISLGYPVRMGHVKVGVEPVSVRFRDNNEIWVVNHISDSVSIIEFESRKLINTLQTADEPFDLVFAGNKAFVSCSQANQLLVFDVNNQEASPQIIEIVAEDPRAMVVSPDGSKVYVAIFESGNKTTLLAGGIDESDGTLGFPNNPVNRDQSPYQGVNPPPNDGNSFTPVINPAIPTPPKVSLIIKQDSSGAWKDDNGADWTHMVSGDDAALSGRIVGWELLDRDIAVIDVATSNVSYVSGLMNIGMAIAYNPVAELLTMVGTDATNEIRFEPNVNGTFLRVNMAVVPIADISNSTVKDLNPHLDYQSSSAGQAVRNQSIGDPRSMIWSADGSTAYVSGMGSNNVVLVNSNGDRLGRIEVGEGPTGLGLDEANKRLYVWNHFEASVSIIDTDARTVIGTTQVFNPLPTAIVEGRKFLYDTHETSGLGHLSCASCHVDSRMDRLSWDLGDPAGTVKTFNQNCQTTVLNIALFQCDDFHPMKGPMMTQTLQDIIGLEPFHWRGDKEGIEAFNGAFVSLLGDDVQLTASQMQQFKDMLSTITFPPNPFRNMDNTLPDSIELKNHYTSGRFSPAGQPLGSGNPQNGLVLYNTALLDNVFQCVSCHTMPTGMAVNGPLMLGVLGASVGGQIMPPGPMGENHLGIVSVDGSTQKSIKTPQLRNMYDKVGFEMSRPQSLAGFGFLHDGAIDSIARFISAPAFSVDSDQEIADIVALMMAFSGSDLHDGNAPMGNIPPESQDTHAGVGKQFILGEATQISAEINQMVLIAESGKVDMVIESADGQSFVFDTASDEFISAQGSNFSVMDLMSLANLQAPLSFTLLPGGLGERLAFDRDGDGVFDFQEVINGSDPTNADSMEVKAKAGLWYNPARSGHGLDIQIAGNNMFIVWYTYNDDGSPTWYIGTSELGQNWQGELKTVRWDHDSRTISSETAGTAQLQFDDARNVTFSWNLAGRTGSEPFKYFDVSNEPTIRQYTGTWYNPSDSGWGMTVFTQGQSQVVVMYYYDQSGLPRWVISNGENQQVNNFEMKSVTGFCPDCEHASTSNEVVGTLKINFLAADSVVLDSNIIYPGDSSNPWTIIGSEFLPLSDPLFDPSIQ